MTSDRLQLLESAGDVKRELMLLIGKLGETEVRANAVPTPARARLTLHVISQARQSPPPSPRLKKAREKTWETADGAAAPSAEETTLDVLDRARKLAELRALPKSGEATYDGRRRQMTALENALGDFVEGSTPAVVVNVLTAAMEQVSRARCVDCCAPRLTSAPSDAASAAGNTLRTGP